MRRRPVIVVLTAGMGAGHDQVGRELCRRLERTGARSELVDLSEVLPAGWGRGLTASYKFMATRAPWLYEFTFRHQMCPKSGRPTVGPVRWPAQYQLQRLLSRHRPSLVLSTFHLCSQVAGHMRASGRLDIPVVSLVVDFFVHPMWVHPAVDAHLLLHRRQAPQVTVLGGQRPLVCGPVVRPEFMPATATWDRLSARHSLGIGPGVRCVLIVSGSWGVGRVGTTVDAVLSAGTFVPVVATGRNRALQASLLSRRGRGERMVVCGWVNDMDRLLAAADVVVDNAGGLTAMEAMARGAPVVTFKPIAGHGRGNVEEMARAGVSVHATTAGDLVSYLDELSQPTLARRNLVSAAQSMFRADAAGVIAAWAERGSVSAELGGQLDLSASAAKVSVEDDSKSMADHGAIY